MCVEATTGSGKTLSFGIPVFEILLRRETPFKKHEIGALVVAPTRELAGQIYSVFEQLAACHLSLKCCLLVGGNAVKDNIEDFESNGGNIFVGTPGRILDIKNRYVHFNFKSYCLLSNVKYLLKINISHRSAFNLVSSI